MEYRPHPERWGPPGGTCILIVAVSATIFGGWLLYQAWKTAMRLAEIAAQMEVPF